MNLCPNPSTCMQGRNCTCSVADRDFASTEHRYNLYRDMSQLFAWLVLSIGGLCCWAVMGLLIWWALQ